MDQEADSLETQFRKTARQLWREYPDLSFDEMVDQHDIQELTHLIKIYDRKKLKLLFLPHPTAGDELPNLRAQGLWTLGDAAALWQDLNPFVFFQAFQQRNPSFFNMPIYTDKRESWMRLRDQASQAVLQGELKGIRDKDQLLVTPQDFYEWGMIHTEGHATGRPEMLFAELKLQWEEDKAKLNPPAAPKPPSKVENKRSEIKRILELIKSVDAEFDSQNMPGKRADFQKLCIHVNKKMFSIADETFNDYLPGLCKFNSGARGTDYYSTIAQQLG